MNQGGCVSPLYDVNKIIATRCVINTQRAKYATKRYY